MKRTGEPIVHAAYGRDTPAGLPVCVGVPFPQGFLKAGASLSARDPAGSLRPAAVRPLARHGDGSLRWGLVQFEATHAGSHTLLSLAEEVSSPPLTAEPVPGGWKVATDRLAFTLRENGPGLFGDLVCDGHPYLAQPSDLFLRVDEATTLHESQRSIRLLDRTSQRVRLRVEGEHRQADGMRRFHYRLDVEVWTGWPALRLDYHLFHREPQRPVERVGVVALESRWNVGPETRRHVLQKNYGLFYVSRHVFNPAPVALVADFRRYGAYVEDPAMLLDDVDYPFYLHPPLVDTQEWLGVVGDRRAVYVQMADFIRAKPNRMVSEGNRIAVEVWPSTAEPVEWPQGRSRRHTIVFAFLENPEPVEGTEKKSNAPRQAPQGVAATLAALLYEGRGCPDPAWIARCGEFGQDRVLPYGRNVRIEHNLHDLVALDMPVTKFDVGDTDSHYNSGYAIISEDLVPKRAGAPDIPRIFPRSQPTQTYLDCHEAVWTNNEYDVIHTFSQELMRTGRFELWETLRLAARHTIEVDFLHYSDHRWLHRATPAHSARHTTTGAYPSHFWTQGLLEYYCLTGDDDALEVALALGDKTVENFTDPELRAVLWGFNREIGWSVLALACLVDVTGEARFQPLLDEMVNSLIAFDRIGFRGAINLSAGNDRRSMNRQIVDNFFGYGSLMEGVDLYARMTGRREVAEWLKTLCHDLADEAIQAAREGEMRGVDFGVALGIGYERTKDRRFLDLATLVLDRAYWMDRGVSGGRSAKPVAMAYRGLMRILGHAWRAGLLDSYDYPSVRRLLRKRRSPTGDSASRARARTRTPKGAR